LITSRSNPLVKRIRALRQKKHRLAEGAFYAEGLRVVLTAIEREAPIECLITSSELLSSETARQRVESVRALGRPVFELSRPLFESISERDNPVGLGAILRAELTPLQELRVRPDGLYAAMLEPGDPGNLGAILRTLDGVGGAGLILVGDAVDPFHPAAVRASMGTLFTIPVSAAEEMAEVLDWARERRVQTVASSAHAATGYDRAAYRLPALLLLGSEGEGLPAAILEAADLAVAIPMRGAASSLNLAVAAGLLLYQMGGSDRAGDAGH
jgi:TrmH family RNA methyltransferase